MRQLNDYEAVKVNNAEEAMEFLQYLEDNTDLKSLTGFKPTEINEEILNRIDFPIFIESDNGILSLVRRLLYSKTKVIPLSEFLEPKVPYTREPAGAKPDGYTLLTTVFEKHILHFDIGDSVYLKTDNEQCERLVTGINIRENGISYAVTCGTNESWHYVFEMTKERDIVKATSS